MFPPALNRLQGAAVRLITVSDHVLQMLILRFDDLISLVAMKCGITRSAHLFTRHRFHVHHLLKVDVTLTAARRPALLDS
jgi:hypothetical protein